MTSRAPFTQKPMIMSEPAVENMREELNDYAKNILVPELVKLTSAYLHHKSEYEHAKTELAKARKLMRERCLSDEDMRAVSKQMGEYYERMIYSRTLVHDLSRAMEAAGGVNLMGIVRKHTCKVKL